MSGKAILLWPAVYLATIRYAVKPPSFGSGNLSCQKENGFTAYWIQAFLLQCRLVLYHPLLLFLTTCIGYMVMGLLWISQAVSPGVSVTRRNVLTAVCKMVMGSLTNVMWCRVP
ncbi:hypothetical protein FKM82_022629 [Ascaphus truei]